MEIIKRKVHVQGMMCSSCEKKIEGAIRKIPGILSVKASFSSGTVEFDYATDAAADSLVRKAIEKAGYLIDGRKGTELAITVGIGLVLIAGFIILNVTGKFNFLPAVDSTFGYGMLFLAGLLTSFHCISMCGGLSISQSIPTTCAAENKEGTEAVKTAPFFKRLVPGIFYNGGRVISYTIIGGIIGAIGSVFNFSNTAKGIITAAAGGFMLFFGLRMLGLFNRFPRLRLKLPKFITRFGPTRDGGTIARDGGSIARKKRGPFIVGVLNGFMPCGPLQTMQIYALGTGGFFAGALSMFLFSAGTVPLMLGLGAIAAFISRKNSMRLVRAGAVLVMFLGIFTLGRAMTLTGFSIPEISAVSQTRNEPEPNTIIAVDNKKQNTLTQSTMEGDFQTVITTMTNRGYEPFVIRKGVPVKWILRVKASDLNGCNNAIIIPEYGIEKALKPGDNLIEFTPIKDGTILFSCWMGMIRSRITVLPGTEV